MNLKHVEKIGSTQLQWHYCCMSLSVSFGSRLLYSTSLRDMQQESSAFMQLLKEVLQKPKN